MLLINLITFICKVSTLEHIKSSLVMDPPLANTGKITIPTKKNITFTFLKFSMFQISHEIYYLFHLYVELILFWLNFFTNPFLVKDLKTKEPFLKGSHKDGLYHMPHLITPTSFITTISSSLPWHHFFGHPNERTLRHILSMNKININTPLPYISCISSKSHKLSFTSSSIISKRKLKIIYANVWESAPIKALDGYL